MFNLEYRCKDRYYLDIINIYQGKIMRKIDRFLQYLEYKGITENKATIECGLSQGLLHQAKSGKSDLGAKTIDKILMKYQDLNRAYLLAGEGEMLKKSSEAQKFAAEVPESDAIIYTVPLLPISAQGGTFNDFVESIKERDCERIVSPIKAVDLAVTVSGDSMAPEYPSGCKILIKKINEEAFIEWGKVYVLDTCNGTVIKEVHKGKSEDEIECHSINPDPKFQPFSVKRNDIYGMYRVLLCMSLK